MERTLEGSGAVTRCERCAAPVLEAGLCPACLLRDGLEKDVTSLLLADSSEQPAAGDGGNGACSQVKLADAPLVDGYELVSELGRGGMGVVYLAEQTRPVRRRVALKLIKLGMDTRQVIARFEAERQALAMMDHPGVAKVLGAGASVTGRPYFVMELVRGPRITEYCDQYHLSTRERLELFLQVCRAIQHSHQKGIIHRDIKPSNILVAQQDGQAVPKVIDFGIAKATDGQLLTDKTVVTGVGQFIGTPAYTSPEQVAGGADIDTRTDIYSLGVLLYELLTGHTPFDSRELLRGGWETMRRTISHTEPQRPSTRLTALSPGEIANIARRRRTEPPKLIHAVRGDLDWIIMKCLEKDRARRYDTCSGIIHDLRRHLHHEPVAARPPGKVYRVQKFVRRNRLGLSVGALIAVTLSAALAVAGWSLAKGKQAEAAVRILHGTGVARTALPKNRPVEVPAPEQALPAEELLPVTTAGTWKGTFGGLKARPDLVRRAQQQEWTRDRRNPESHGDPLPMEQAHPSPSAGFAPGSGNSSTPSGPTGSASSTGVSYSQLSAAWWAWMMQLPLTNSAGAVHPVLDSPFFDVSAGQEGRVWFLATPFGAITRSCVIPPDTWLFVGMVNVESSTLEGETIFFGLTAQEQADRAAYFADHITGMYCEVNGVPVPDLQTYRVRSPQISFTAPTPWIFGATGGRGTSVGDGYFMLISPLGPGQHTLRYGGAFHFQKPPDLFDLYAPMEMTYHLRVR